MKQIVQLQPDEKQVTEQDFHVIPEKVREWKEQGHSEKIDAKEVRCDACGANVVFLGSLASSSCSYCGSPIQLDDVSDRTTDSSRWDDAFSGHAQIRPGEPQTVGRFSLVCTQQV